MGRARRVQSTRTKRLWGGRGGCANDEVGGQRGEEDFQGSPQSEVADTCGGHNREPQRRGGVAAALARRLFQLRGTVYSVQGAQCSSNSTAGGAPEEAVLVVRTSTSSRDPGNPVPLTSEVGIGSNNWH